MAIVITQEQKEKFFEKWEDKQLRLLTKEKADEIMEFAINKLKVFDRDNNKCQNEYHQEMIVRYSKGTDEITIHHIIPRSDFKLNPSLVKYLGYTVHSMRNMITLCHSCHQHYERAKGHIKLVGNPIPFLKTKIQAVKYKLKIKEARLFRKRLIKQGEIGWGKITDEGRWKLVASLMWFVFQDWETTVEFDN